MKFIILFFSFIFCWSAFGSPKFVANEILVKYKPGVSEVSQISRLGAEGFKVLEKVYRSKNQSTEIYRLKIPMGELVEATVDRLAKEPSVEIVEPNYIFANSAVPNDTYFSTLWAHRNFAQVISFGTISIFSGPKLGVSTEGNPGTSGMDMNMITAWNKRTDCSSVVVAVIDSGINYNHEDLAANMWDGSGAGYPNHGYDFANSDNDPLDDHGHGTHVAGTIGAKGNNSKGVTGVCWQANLMAIKALGSTGSGSNSNIISGINFAVARGAKVINMSIGGSGASALLQSAILGAGSSDVAVISAAGNDGTNNDSTPIYPCNYGSTKTLCVAAMTGSGDKASFSNFGVSNVQIAAPGVNILSTWHLSRTTTSIPVSTGWTSSSTGASTWGTNVVIGYAGLTMPSNYNGTLQYSSNTDARLSRTFDFTGSEDIWIRYVYRTSFGAGDSVRVFAQTGTLDAIPGGGSIVNYTSSSASYFQATLPVGTYCKNTNCNVGWQFSADASGSSSGFAMFLMESIGFGSGTLGYNTIDGTSMAAPQVAGVAAMLRAQNPNYTAADVVSAIKGGGRVISGLSSVVSTSKSLDALGALSYIQAPTGVTASQAP